MEDEKNELKISQAEKSAILPKTEDRGELNKLNWADKSNFSPLRKDRSSNRNFFGFVLIGALFFYIGLAWGKKTSVSDSKGRVFNFVENLADPKSLFVNTNNPIEKKVDFNLFWEAWEELDEKYVDKEKLDPQKRLYGAINGMIGALGDPYSSFMDPEESKDFSQEMEGEFEGIGAELSTKDGILVIIAPIAGTPADKAGLRSGDKILEINKESTANLTVDEAVRRIRGKKGTEVVLTILREGDYQSQEIKIIRDKIEIKSVIYEKKEENIAYLRVTKFAENTSKEFSREVAKIIADGSRGLILDLRSNPGGYLNSAVELASKFIPEGQLVVSEKGRDGDNREYRALGGDSLGNLPTVVLIDQGSASASEILAGALRDNKGIKLIGEKSFGKGSVQQLEDLKDGSTMRITIAKWFTPKGACIHEVGLEPDIKVEFSKEDIANKRDVQLERALEELKNQIKR